VVCECGVVICRDSKNTQSHIQSQKHQEYLKTIPVANQNESPMSQIKDIPNYENLSLGDKIMSRRKIEKITCDCGICLRKSGMWRHINSKHHIDYIKRFTVFE
jgi:hypothetical protein